MGLIMDLDRDVLVRVTRDNSEDIQRIFFDNGICWMAGSTNLFVPGEDPDEYWIGATYDPIRSCYVLCWIELSGGERYIGEGKFIEIQSCEILNIINYDRAMGVI